MLRDITLGQYYPVDSVIHRLDPRVKLLGTLLFLVSLFINDNFIGILVALCFLALAIKLSKVPFKFMVKGMKAITVLLMFSVVLNLFLTKGTVIFSFWKISITKEGIYTAVFMAVSVYYQIITACYSCK